MIMNGGILLVVVILVAASHATRVLTAGKAMEQEWALHLPQVTTISDANIIIMDFNVSDLMNENTTRVEIFENDCESPRINDFINYITMKDDYSVEFQMDVLNLAKDPYLFNLDEYPIRASFELCARYTLATGPENDPSAIEVNHMDILLTAYILLQKGFALDGELYFTEKNTTMGDEHNITEQDGFGAEGYLCDEVTHEKIEAPNNGFIPGAFICICAQLNERAIETGLVIKGVAEFKWDRTYVIDGQTYEAVQYSVNNFVAADSLTIYNCPPLATFCSFKTILQSDFYALPGNVTGSGYVQFEFAPVSRRRLGRRLQLSDSEPESTMEFVLPVAPFSTRPALLGTSGGEVLYRWGKFYVGAISLLVLMLLWI